MKIQKKNKASINLCIIGSTNFGKTTIATALFDIASKTDGEIHAIGKQDELAKMKTELDNGQLKATSWEDIAKFKFELDDGEKSWEISLHDYPGGLFEKYIGQGPKRWFFKQSKQNQNEFVFDKSAENKAKNLTAQLEQADILMILVPADINESQYNTARSIYKNQLAGFIKKILSKKTNIPVCLCINKWDMFDCGIEKLEDKLKEEPFCDFYQTLKLICGNNLSIAAISAFGEHDPEDKKKINAGRHKPLNVLETLRPLAVRAEKARYERNVNEWKQSSLFQKILFFPEKTRIWKKAGYTDTNIRTGLNKMAAKAWGLFIVFWLIILSILLGGVTADRCVYEYIGFKKIENSCEDYEKNSWKLDNKEKLLKVKENINHPTITRQVFFRKKVKELNFRYLEIEEKYNKRIVQDAEKFCDEAPNRDIPSWSNPDERKKRTNRRKTELELKQRNLTQPKSIKALKELVAKEDKLLEDIEKNYDFYKKAFAFLKDQDRKTICRRLRFFIDSERSARPDQKELFGELEKDLDKKEKEIVKELETEINEYQNTNPANTAASRAQQDHKIRQIIKKYEHQFAVNSTNFKKFEQMRVKLSQDEAEQKTYGPFDIAYSNLNKNNLRAVTEFIEKYSLVNYPKRKDKISDLKKLKQQLFETIQDDLNEKLNNAVDKPDHSAEDRIANCNTRINALEDAINNKFDPQSEESGRREKQLGREKDLLKRLKKYNSTEKEISALIESGTARKIEDFLKKYPKDAYKDAYHEKIFKDLKERQNRLLKQITKTLKNSLQQNLEDEKLPAEENFKRAKIRENAYRLASSEYIERSPVWEESQERVRQESNIKDEWKRYIDFEKDYNKVKSNHDSKILKSIDTFMTKYEPNRKLYSKRDNYFVEIERLRNKKMGDFKAQCDAELKNISEPEFKNFPGWIDYYTRKTEILTKFRNYYPKSYLELDQPLLGCKKQCDKYKQWNDLHLRAEAISKSKEKPEFILPKIYQFFEDFPKDKNTASQIEDDIKRISEKQNIEVAKILKELTRQLDEYKPEDATDESEKQDFYSKRIEIIDKFLYLLRGTDHINTYKAQKNIYEKKLDNSKREQMFASALEKVKATLEDPAISASEKISAINRFIISYDDPDSKSDHKNDFNELEFNRNRYEIELRWKEITKEKLKRPDNDEALIAYRDSCLSRKNVAKQYVSNHFLKDRVSSEIKKLDDEIKWVNTKIGDGTYVSIKKKEKLYKDNLTEENYKILHSEIKSFDPTKPENNKQAESVDRIKKDSDAYHGIEAAFNLFCQKPNQTNWDAFDTVVQKTPSDYPQKYQEYCNRAKEYLPPMQTYNKQKELKVTLIKWDYRNSRFHKSSTDCCVWLGTNITMNTWQIDLRAKHSKPVWDKKKHMISSSSRLEKWIHFEGPSLEIAFANIAGLNEFSSRTNLTIFEILAKSKDKGECDIPIKDADSPAFITLNFSGLPRVQK